MKPTTSDAEAMLDAAQSVLLVDWPSRDVPDSLARAGFEVNAQEGAGIYGAYVRAGDAVERRDVKRPAHVDLVYAYRPLEELTDILDLARELGARAIWIQSDRSVDEIEAARRLVEGAGLTFVSEPNILDALRARGG